MTPVEYILKENKNCNMWWTHTNSCIFQKNEYLTKDDWGSASATVVSKVICLYRL